MRAWSRQYCPKTNRLRTTHPEEDVTEHRLRYHLGSHHRLGGWPQVWLAVNSRPDWCLVCDDRYSMSVRFSSAGVACVGRASFRVWPPPLRERPQWEGHLHNSRSGRSNGTIYASTCVRGTHVSPGSVGTTTALQSEFELLLSVLSGN